MDGERLCNDDFTQSETAALRVSVEWTFAPTGPRWSDRDRIGLEEPCTLARMAMFLLLQAQRAETVH